jgi:hypothetical protein
MYAPLSTILSPKIAIVSRVPKVGNLSIKTYNHWNQPVYKKNFFLHVKFEVKLVISFTRKSVSNKKEPFSLRMAYRTSLKTFHLVGSWHHPAPWTFRKKVFETKTKTWERFSPFSGGVFQKAEKRHKSFQISQMPLRLNYALQWAPFWQTDSAMVYDHVRTIRTLLGSSRSDL